MTIEESMTTEKPLILYNSGDDPEMGRAFEKARRTFRFFWQEVAWEQRRVVPGLEMAAVKAAFSDLEEVQAENTQSLKVEHMWVVDVDFDGIDVDGTLTNGPTSLRSFNAGDRVAIPLELITDWIYVAGGEVCGGFTIDVMRSRMERQERKQHDRAWGLEFPKVGAVKIVPSRYLENGPAKKKRLFARFGSSRSEPQDYAEVAAREHPMSANMRESLDQTLRENPSMLQEANDHGYAFLHQLALAGSLDGVDICLQHGANPNHLAPNGMTPYALAESLGWKRVMARLQESGGTSCPRANDATNTPH